MIPNKFGLNLFLCTPELTRTNYPLLGKIRRWGYDMVKIRLLNPDRLDVPYVKALLAEDDLDCMFCTVIPPKPIGAWTGDKHARPESNFSGNAIDMAANWGTAILSGGGSLLASSGRRVSGNRRRIPIRKLDGYRAAPRENLFAASGRSSGATAFKTA